jgi:hypothetical protein
MPSIKTQPAAAATTAATMAISLRFLVAVGATVPALSVLVLIGCLLLLR